MKRISLSLCGIAAGLCLLAGASVSAQDGAAQVNALDGADAKDIGGCTVSLLQNGQELKYQAAGLTRIYQLQSAPFRIEVSSETCEASIGTFRSVNDLMFVASNPYVVSPSGLGMASVPHDDVLVRRSEDPRPSPDDLSVFNAQKAEILKLCAEYGRCPAQIYAIRNYWPFLVDANATRARVADIVKLNDRQPIANAIGPVPIIIYTKAHMNEAEVRPVPSTLAILEAHPILLMFRGPVNSTN